MKKVIALSMLALSMVLAGCSSPNVDSKSYTGIEINDTNSTKYTLSSIYDVDNGLVVQGILASGKKEDISKENYTYSVINSSGNAIDTSKSFDESGNYIAVVNYQNKFSKSYSFTVAGQSKTLTGVDFEITKTTFVTTDILNNTISSIFTAKLIYNDSSYNVDNIRYSELNAYNLKLDLLNPSGTKTNLTTAFGTSGNWTLKLSSTENTSLSKSKTIVVNNSSVKVTSISISPSSASLQVGDTTSLSVSVKPDNATNKNVTWSSTDTSICTVSNGTVSAKKAGNAVIKATSQDGSGVYGSCSVTVTDKAGEYEYKLVNTIDDLSSGDLVIIASNDNKTVAGNIKSTKNASYLASLSATFSADNETLSTFGSDTTIFTVGKSGTNWTFTNSSTSALLGATDAKKLTYSGGITTWSLSITNGDAKIASTTSTYGYIQYNTDSPRFCNYTSTKDIQVLPQLYKKTAKTPIYPESIALTEKSVSLGKGSTHQLNVTYSPKGVNIGKEVTWSSSNPNVATVSTTGLVSVSASATVGSTATITVKSTYNANLTDTCLVTVSEVAQDKWTILLYICGSNLESDDGAATADIKEILSVQNQPDDVNIVIETGGSEKDSGYFSTSALKRYHVSNQKMVSDGTVAYASMGASSTLQNFIEYGVSNYPADKIGLILWNHGGGLSGVCFDDLTYDGSSYDSLLNSEVKTAVKNAFITLGRTEKFEFIGYDACLMGLQDIAEFNSTYFNYMVASEESEAGTGWAYNTWIDDVYNNKSTLEILKANVDGFIDSVGASKTDPWENQCLSVYDLSKMSAYKSAFESMAASLKTKITNKTTFTSMMKNVKYFGSGFYSSWSELCEYESFSDKTEAQQYGCYYDSTSGAYVSPGYNYYAYFDVGSFLTKVKNNYSIDVSGVETALDNLVAYEAHQKAAGNEIGIALFFPIYDFSAYDTWYKTSETNFTNWRAIVNL